MAKQPEVELDIRIGQKTYVSIVSVIPLENGKPVLLPKKVTA